LIFIETFFNYFRIFVKQPCSSHPHCVMNGFPQKRKYMKKQQKRNKHLLNYQIKFPKIRLVNVFQYDLEDGVYDTQEALQVSKKLELDLVLISSGGNPPVCKIVDYTKFIYDENKKDKKRNQNQIKVVLKEMRFTPNTDTNDFEVKAKKIRQFLEKKNKVKVWVQFKGREITHKERGEIILLNLLQKLEDIGTPEMMPKLEGRRMITIIKPKK